MIDYKMILIIESIGIDSSDVVIVHERIHTKKNTKKNYNYNN